MNRLAALLLCLSFFLISHSLSNFAAGDEVSQQGKVADANGVARVDASREPRDASLVGDVPDDLEP